MKFKLTFIGAGSIGFTRKMVYDILSVPEFKDIEIAFTDINPHNLETVTKICQREIDANGLKIKILATADRRAALKNADYVINVVRIGGLEAFEKDVDIPLRYGVDQCVGDTLCAGGIMYAQRGIYAMLEFCKDIREVANKDCILFNYANPNAMVTWACNKYGKVKTIGLCHGVQGGHRLIAEAFGVTKEEIAIKCVGINHMTWYTEIMYKGKNVKDELLSKMESHPRISKTEKVRIDVLKRMGYFSTESNGHLSEYLPYYRKRAGEIANWISTDKWIHGETGGYLRECREQRNWFEDEYGDWDKKEPAKYDGKYRSEEHVSYIIEGLRTGRIYRGHFNVVNNGAVSNLPDDCIVELPCYADLNGINVAYYGELPFVCAALCVSNINVQRLAVEAAVHADINLLKQAFLLDPLTGAVLNPPEIWQLCDEMLIEEAEWLPQYAAEIKNARKRIAAAKKDGSFIPVNEGYRGAVRLKEKSVETLKNEKNAIK